MRTVLLVEDSFIESFELEYRKDTTSKSLRRLLMLKSAFGN